MAQDIYSQFEYMILPIVWVDRLAKILKIPSGFNFQVALFPGCVPWQLFYPMALSRVTEHDEDFLHAESRTLEFI